MAYFSSNFFAPSLAIPAEAPGLAFTSKTATTITIAHTLPGDTSNYATSKIFYGIPGAIPSTALSSATESVVLSGLAARTQYLIYAVSQSAGGAQLGSSEALSVYTLADGSVGTSVDQSKILRSPGRFTINPTDLSATFPYGGTALGGARSVRLEVDKPHLRIPNPERGGLQEAFDGAQRVRLVAILREFNDAVLGSLFRSSVTGGTSTDKGLRVPQSGDLPGKKVTDLAVKLLWVPYNTAQHPAVLIPRALPILSQSIEALSAFSERTRLVEFEAALDATGRLYTEELIEDMTL